MLVLDEVAQEAVLTFLHGSIQGSRVAGHVEDAAHPLRRHIEGVTKLFFRWLAQKGLL